MKKMKKILAMLLALTMVLGMSLTTFANENTHTDAIRVYGVEEAGVTVTAYQIIKYNANGFYEEVLSNSITKTAEGDLNPTATDVAALAIRTSELTNPQPITLSKTEDYYTGTLTAGTWMIIVTGSTNYLYNPAIISVEQGAGGLVYGELNLNTDSWGNQLYVKKSEPRVTKEAEEIVTDDAVNGVQYGDKVKYTVTIDIPSYTPSVVDDALITVTDTLVDAVLVDVSKATVTIEGANENAVAYVQDLFNTALAENAASFTLTIDNEDWLTENAGKQVVLTYWAKVTAAAEKVDELTNTVTYVYTTNHDPITKTDMTRHYTFSIDGEFVKVNDENEVLSGAEFQLHIGNATGDLYKDASGAETFTTDNDGKLVIRGLDCDTVYYLVETKAPTGYTINDEPVKVEFDAEFNNDGTYKEHVVKLDGVEHDATTPYEFVNTTLIALPSTGGIGTTIFTVAGCGIMIAAAFFFFASRKKEN